MDMEWTIKDYVETYWSGNLTPEEIAFATINEKDYCEAFGFDWNDWLNTKRELVENAH